MLTDSLYIPSLSASIYAGEYNEFVNISPKKLTALSNSDGKNVSV